MPCACLSRVVGADATVVPSNLLHCVILCVHVLSLSCDKRYNSVGKALPCRGLLRWERWAERSSGPSSARVPPAGVGRGGRRVLPVPGAAWPGRSSVCCSCTAACSPAMRPAALCTDTACSAAWSRPAWPARTAPSRVRPGPGGAERGRAGLVGRDTRTGPVLLRGGSVRAAPRLLSPVIPREGGSPAPDTGAKHSGAGPSVLSSPRLASLGPEQRQARGPVGLVSITHALLCIFWRHASVCPRRQVPLLPQGMGRVMCLRPST